MTTLIPSFNPGDSVLYPLKNGVINVGAADAGSKALFYNESPYNLNLDFYNGSQKILHAWEARYFILDGDTKQIGWSIGSQLAVVGTPISLVMGELYSPSEQLEGTYPLALIRQTNVGNQGTVTATAATSIQNDSNAAGTSVLEATVTGQITSNVSITNDAIARLALVIGGIEVPYFQSAITGSILSLGAAGYTTENLGKLIVDQKIQSNSDEDNYGSNGIFFHNAGAGIKFSASGGSLSGLSVFGPINLTTTSTFFTHGLNVVPSIVLCVFSGNGSAVRSYTVDFGAMTTSQVRITGSGSFSAYGIAIAL